VALPSLNPALLAVAVVVLGVGLAAWSMRALSARRRDDALGSLVAIDAGRAAVLRSYRYRMQGRPDALRQLSDGRWVPVEVKSRACPPSGPTRSHRVQVWAYCLLVEEATGRAPPFGILRYADREFRLPWDAATRRDLLGLRAELLRPYDGRATPSPSRCARCPWVAVCEVRAAGG
jgi:CRISPR-associated exonuclease Cas4